MIKEGRRIDLSRPIPERRPRAGEKVSFLAACPLTRAFALEDTQLADAARTGDVLSDEQMAELAKA